MSVGGTMQVSEIKTEGAAVPPAVFRFVTASSRFLGSAAILAMFFGVMYEVISRSFFGHGTIWVTEISTYLVLVITFVTAAFAVSQGAHVRVDLVVEMFAKDTRNLITAATRSLSLFLSLIVLWKMTGYCAENYVDGSRSWSLLNTPLWLPQTSAVLGLIGLSALLGDMGPSRAGLWGYIPLIAAIAFALLGGAGVISLNLTQAQSVSILALLAALTTGMVAGIAPLAGALAIAAVAALLFFVAGDLTLAAKSAVLIVGLLFLLLTGLPVAFCLLAVGIYAMLFWLPPITLNYVGERAWESINTFELAAIPMFILMGAILVRTNASAEMFAAARLALGRLKGGQAYASIMASGIFAAVSGSSLATAATMGRVAGPEMIKAGYRPSLAYGVLAAGGTLGILIPPSVAMIIYGPLAGVPVTKLFIAGIIPGILMMVAFAIVVAVWVWLDKTAAPVEQQYTLSEKIRAMRGILPFVLLVSMVLGALYTGITTPTEAGAMGVFGAVLISLGRRTFTFQEFMRSLEEAAMTTSFLLLIAVGASVMGFAIDYLALPQELVKFVQALDLSDLGLFIAIVVLYLILGTFVESISMVLMTLPVILPVLAAAGWDPLWFGVILVMLVEIGLITPPVGMILYVIAGVAEDRTAFAATTKGSLPFVAVFLFMVFVFFFVPEFVTFLPTLMN